MNLVKVSGPQDESLHTREAFALRFYVQVHACLEVNFIQAMIVGVGNGPLLYGTDGKTKYFLPSMFFFPPSMFFHSRLCVPLEATPSIVKLQVYS